MAKHYPKRSQFSILIVGCSMSRVGASYIPFNYRRQRMALAEGVAALKSLKSLYEIARDVRDSHDPEKLRVAAAQMFDLALAAREQTALLQEERNSAIGELTALKLELEKANNFDGLAANYVRLRDSAGAFTYRERENTAESPHYCPHCFDRKVLSILQPKDGVGKLYAYYMFGCLHCGANIPLSPP